VGSSDFQERIARINKTAKQQSVEEEAEPVRLTLPESTGMGAYLWGAFGTVWGVVSVTLVMFAFENYQLASANTQSPELFTIVVTIGAIGLFFVAIFVLLLVLSLIYFRSYQGLRLLLIGYGAGSLVAGVAMALG